MVVSRFTIPLVFIVAFLISGCDHNGSMPRYEMSVNHALCNAGIPVTIEGFNKSSSSESIGFQPSYILQDDTGRCVLVIAPTGSAFPANDERLRLQGSAVTGNARRKVAGHYVRIFEAVQCIPKSQTASLGSAGTFLGVSVVGVVLFFAAMMASRHSSRNGTGLLAATSLATQLKSPQNLSAPKTQSDQAAGFFVVAGLPVPFRQLPFPDARGRIVVGSAPEPPVSEGFAAYMQIANKFVSRLHGEIEFDRGSWYYIGAITENRTRVDGILVYPTLRLPLHHDSLIDIADGEVKLRFTSHPFFAFGAGAAQTGNSPASKFGGRSYE